MTSTILTKERVCQEVQDAFDTTSDLGSDVKGRYEAVEAAVERQRQLYHQLNQQNKVLEAAWPLCVEINPVSPSSAMERIVRAYREAQVEAGAGATTNPAQRDPATCRHCKRTLRGDDYRYGGQAYRLDNGVRARMNHYGGFVCSEACDRAATLELEMSMPGHSGQRVLSAPMSTRITTAWSKEHD